MYSAPISAAERRRTSRDERTVNTSLILEYPTAAELLEVLTGAELRVSPHEGDGAPVTRA